MPTITSAIATTLVTGPPGKGPASLLATTEPGFDFQTLLGATAIIAQPPVGEPGVVADSVRQPVAADGSVLPVEAAPIAVTPAPAPPLAPVPAAAPAPAAAAAAPAGIGPVQIMPAVAVVTTVAPAKMAMPRVEDPAPPAPDKIVPSLAAIPSPAMRQVSIVSTKTAPKRDQADAAGNSEPSETPLDPPVLTALPIAPTAPLPTPVPGAKLAKAPAPPSISVVRSAPAARPVVAAAIPQTTRDIRWEGATPVVTPLAVPPAMVAPLPPIEGVVLPIAGPAAPAAPTSPLQVRSADFTPVAAMPSPAPQLAAPAALQAAPIAAAAIVPTTIVAGPALQVFGAAISAAARRERGEDAADPLASLGTIAAPAAPIAAPVTTADQPMLDMRQERWPQAMIAHIESLRDNADATDTRIRLVPDALGTIDVAVTRDRDTVHVQFTAEQATTRALIQDAQPRLAALAEERGLRLGQTVVDASAAGAAPQQPQQSQQQRQPQRDAALPAAPRRATDRHDDQDRADDGRLA
ncbi:flagellar hook-length control protein FliK [Sphingomonas sp. Tas61C01]|uniref:flagellar hook-length control protein FliK n=1 Tax=Sphingomonas sp. Tas61C01 TaxID=3458297 RepID=UPI00403E7BA2